MRPEHTLKLWDLDTHTCLLTHCGDVDFTSVAATEAAVMAGDLAGTPVPRLTASHVHRAAALRAQQG